jgi:peptidoglycan/LPS O-acetylase OafA/YrhL
MLYRRDIDGLRGIAVLLVVIYHFFPESITGGFVGVDIFFVISGFIISQLLFREIDKGTFSFGHFYERRIKRLFPTLLTVIIVLLTFGWFVFSAEFYKELAKHSFSGLSFFSNLTLFFEAGYFDKAAESKPLLHLWSLSIEEQFYLLFPIFFLLLRKFNSKIRILTIAAVLGASFYANLYLVGHFKAAAFYLLPTRIWELMFGILISYLGYYYPGFNKFFDKFANLFAILALIILKIGLHNIHPNTLFPGTWALFPVVAASLLLLTKESLFNRYILSNRVLVFVGLISYALYLWHWPVICVFNYLSLTPGTMVVKSLLFLLCIILAIISTYLIERPIRDSRFKIQDSRFKIQDLQTHIGSLLRSARGQCPNL